MADLHIIENGVLSFDGTEIHSSLADRMIDFAMRGMDLTAMQNFMINLMDNSSYRAVTELYGFLEAGKLPITQDGHFLAYKKVRDNFTDVHSGKFDNSPGVTVTMPRNQVNEDKNQTCSTGLHFCSYDYLSQFGGERVVVLKINPKDVVSIPSDYNNTKGRCCAYEVLRELEDYVEERIEGFYAASDDDDDWNGPEWDENDEELCFDCNETVDDCDCDDGLDELEIAPYNDEDELGEDDAYVGETEDDFEQHGFDPFDEDFGPVTLREEDRDKIPQPGTAVLHTDDTDSTTPALPDLSVRAETTWVQRSLDGITAVDERNGVRYVYSSVIEAHKELGVPVEYIRRVLEGERESAMGYIFAYAK